MMLVEAKKRPLAARAALREPVKCRREQVFAHLSTTRPTQRRPSDEMRTITQAPSLPAPGTACGVAPGSAESPQALRGPAAGSKRRRVARSGGRPSAATAHAAEKGARQTHGGRRRDAAKVARRRHKAARSRILAKPSGRVGTLGIGEAVMNVGEAKLPNPYLWEDPAREPEGGSPLAGQGQPSDRPANLVEDVVASLGWR